MRSASLLPGSSVGAFVLVRLLSLFAVSYGWRTSYFYLGIVMLIVNSLLAIFVIKGDPRHLGMAEETGYSDGDAGRKKSPAGVGLRQAMATRSFWLFLATMFVCGSGDYLATSHFINFATDIGVSPITAGNMMSWYGLFSFAGMLVAGPAADRIGSKMPVVLTFVLRFLLYLFIVKYKNVPSLYVFALLFGFTHLITAPLTPMLMGRLYGFRQIGLLTGVVNTVHFLGGGIFTYATGVIFDRTGSYQTAFIAAAAMAAAAALCSSLIAEKSHVPGLVPAEARTSVPAACCLAEGKGFGSTCRYGRSAWRYREQLMGLSAPSSGKATGASPLNLASLVMGALFTAWPRVGTLLSLLCLRRGVPIIISANPAQIASRSFFPRREKRSLIPPCGPSRATRNCTNGRQFRDLEDLTGCWIGGLQHTTREGRL